MSCLHCEFLLLRSSLGSSNLNGLHVVLEFLVVLETTVSDSGGSLQELILELAVVVGDDALLLVGDDSRARGCPPHRHSGGRRPAPARGRRHRRRGGPRADGCGRRGGGVSAPGRAAAGWGGVLSTFRCGPAPTLSEENRAVLGLSVYYANVNEPPGAGGRRLL